MKNYVQPGETITVVAPYALSPGDGCQVGAVFGISAGSYASGADAEVFVDDAVFDITALSTDTVAANTPTLAYWDNTNKRITTSSSGNTKVGVIIAVKASGDTTARVRLNGAF